jgi:hypothetical protein
MFMHPNMKKTFVLLALVYFSSEAFSQKRRRGAGERSNTEWKVNRDIVVSGDTVTFTFTNTSYPKFYCYRESEFYTLYRIENGAEVLAEDTLFRGVGKPVPFLQGDKLILKKQITKPGSYVIHYPVYFDTDRPVGGRRRLDMKQYFDVEKKL